jgi:uncharacterized iron-regulated membrane protein
MNPLKPKNKPFNHKLFWRKIHYWGAIACLIPVLIMIITGVLLLLKKELDWIQPPTVKTESRIPALSFDQILTTTSLIPEAGITTFADIDRIDVRPGKGVIKVRAKSGWEIQLHPETADILAVAYRRSELIEAIHDGSFFHDQAKLGLFLPAAIILLALSLTGLYLFFLPLLAKARKNRKRQQNQSLTPSLNTNSR